MSDNSNIEWCDATWQVTHGCKKIAAGCANCYAIKDAHRMAGHPNAKISGPRQGLTVDRSRPYHKGKRLDWTGIVRTAPENLDWPLRKRKPLRIFVNSNSDLFHEDVPFEYIAAVYGVMAACPQHTFIVLTKRPERMLAFMEWLHDPSEGLVDASLACDTPRKKAHYCGLRAVRLLPNLPRALQESFNAAMASAGVPLPNVWHGVSIANQQDADANIPILLQVPSAIRFVSAEPLIGPVYLQGNWTNAEVTAALGTNKLDWVIVGGESGPGARPCGIAWIRSIVEQCKAAGVPVFVKQLGAKVFTTDADMDFKAAEKRGDAYACYVDRTMLINGGGAAVFRCEGGEVVDEGDAAYPWPTTGKGGDPSEWPEDLRVRKIPEVQP